MKLANDICRCNGVQCDRASQCARYVLRAELGPRTPIAAQLCEPGRESESFIALRRQLDERN